MSDETIDRTRLPIWRAAFSGVANQTLGGSEPGWEQIGHVKPPDGAPNVLVVLIDDAGFGNPGAFGGPIDTPNYDRVAGEGLRYNRFNVTAMCSPTRAALMTGRNHGWYGGHAGGVERFPGLFGDAAEGRGAVPERATRSSSAAAADHRHWRSAVAVHTNAVKKSLAQIDGMSAKELKAGLAEAQAGMGG